MGNVSEKNTHFVFNNFFFFENLAVYEMLWKNTLEPDGPQRQYGAQKHVICMLVN